MKLNKDIECEKYSTTAVSSYLSEFISSICLSYDASINNINLTEENGILIQDFYDNYYEKLNNNGQVPKWALPNSLKLSTQEAAVLNYFLGGINKTKPFVLLGHAGVGKSTLLKYISYYLYIKYEKLSSLFLPSYISLSDYYVDIKAAKQKSEAFVSDFYKILDQAIYEKTRKYIKNYLYNECSMCQLKKMFKWIDDNVDSLFGTFNNKKIDHFAENIDVFISELEASDKMAFFLGSLSYIARQTSTRVVIFIDNIDRFGVDVNLDCMSYADRKQNLGFQCVLAMRNSTYKYIDSITHEKMDNVEKLSYSYDTVKAILEKRIGNCREGIKLNFKYSLSTTKKDVLDAFSRLLLCGESMDSIIRLSNGNLDKLFRKIKLIGDSDYFDEQIIATELISSKVDEHHKTKGIPTWLLYSMLLGNCRGSFKSGINTKIGIINLFCNQSSNHRPYTFFSRIHLLMRLCNEYESKDECYLPANKWFSEYRLLFGSDFNFYKTFMRSVFRLIQEGLIHTESCDFYNSEEEMENGLIRHDGVAISTAGKFYLTDLMYKLEYLYFMKDDVRWREKILDFSLSAKQTNRKTKIGNTLKALMLLGNYERRMLLRLREESSNSENNLVDIYSIHYSPFRINEDCNSVFYTRNMYHKIRSYVNSVGDNYFDEFTSEINGLKELFESECDVEKSYSI